MSPQTDATGVAIVEQAELWRLDEKGYYQAPETEALSRAVEAMNTVIEAAFE